MAEPPHPTPTTNAEPQPRKRLDAGTIIADRYRILELVGEGSMGTVYAAEHLHLKKKMALKVLHPELMSVKSLAIRFEREAMATAKIDHPNVASAVDFGRITDGSLYLALEYVEGRSLRSEIASGPIALPRALHIATQIASLLAAAQPLGIVHRDLKPENVMLVHRGDDPDFVKVLDFGIARITEPAAGEAVAGAAGPTQPLTKVGAVFGTPEYMAPEQALGQRVDTRADLYSLGVILFEMIGGVRPYGQTGAESGILARQITAPRPSFADVAPHLVVPDAVERVVNRLLAKGASERYQRASDVVRVLESLAVGAEAVGPSGSLVPARDEALPAFELTTHVPGLTDADTSPAPPNESERAEPSRSSAQGRFFEHILVTFREANEKVANARWLSRARTVPANLWQRSVRRWGPLLRGIPPLAVVAFCVGLSIGLLVAIVVWIVAATRPEAATDPARAASASAAAVAAPSGMPSSPVPSSAPTTSTVSTDPSKDPEVMLGLMQTKLDEGSDREAIGLAVKLLARHSDRRSDGRVAEALYRLANSNARDAADTAFALLQGTMATQGADILYQLSFDKGVRESTRRRAEKWLRSEQFARSASNALVIAVRLRFAETCEKKHELLPLVAKGGNTLALPYLKELENENGCGLDGKADCFPCLRKDVRLKEAIAQVGARAP